MRDGRGQAGQAGRRGAVVGLGVLLLHHQRAGLHHLGADLRADLLRQDARVAALHALAHVLLQRAGHGEGHVAELALKHVLADAAVGLHVARQLGRLGAGVVAQRALVGLLAGVGAPVHRQVAAVLEHLAAELARVVAAALLAGEDGAAVAGRQQGGAGARLGDGRQARHAGRHL